MRFLAALCIIFLLVVSVTTSLAFADTKHGCAPLTPPFVSGALIKPSAIHGLLFINEALTVPRSTWNCSEVGTYSPVNDTWVELYNVQDQPFDLYAVHASLDSGPGTNLFYLPFGSAIAAHGFLVVFPRTSSAFLSTETATLRLLMSGVVVDEVSIPSISEDQSYARIPDGTANWQTTSSPTIDASNMLLAQATATHGATSSSVSHTRDGGSDSGGSSGGSWDNGGTTGSTDHSRLVNGVQPTWSTLQLPSTGSPSSFTATSPAVAAPSPQTSDSMDIPRKILLTLLVVALALALLWCWRLFRTS